MSPASDNTSPLTPHGAPILRRWPAARVALAILCFAALLYVANLSRKGFWTDEFRTLVSIRQDFASCVIERLEYGHLPAYFSILHVWRGIAGEREWTLRLPSLVMILGAAWFVFRSGRLLWGDTAALLALLFFVFNGRVLWASVEARPYALLILSAAGALHGLLRWLREPRPGSLAQSTAWAALGLTTHATYLFVFIALTLVTAFHLWRARRWSNAWLACTLGLAALTAAMTVIVSRFNTVHKFFQQPRLPEFEHFRETALQLFFGEYDFYIGSGFKYLGIPLIVLCIVLAIRASRRLARETTDRPPLPGLLFAAGVLLAAPLCLALVSATYKFIAHAIRYYVLGVAGAALIMALAVVGLRRPAARWSLAGLLLLVQLVVCIQWSLHPGHQVREAWEIVARDAGPEEAVLACKHTNAGVMARYYGYPDDVRGIDRELHDREALREIVTRTVGDAPGFWLVLYGDHDNPIANVAARWAEDNGYRRVLKESFYRASVRRWRRE